MSTTEIIRAIKQGPRRLTKTVKALQKKGHVVDNTALYEVLAANDIKAVNMILSCPLFANIGDRHEGYDNETPLTYVMNMLETPHGIDYRAVVAQLLFSGKFDVNQKDRYGRTALHVAAKLGIDCIVELLLLTEGTDVNAEVAYTVAYTIHDTQRKDYRDCGKTALELALRTGRKRNIDRLLRDTVVTLFVDEEEGKVVLRLRAIETDVQGVLTNAVDKGTIETVRLLLDDHRVDVNATLHDGSKMLHLAVLRGDEDICRVLLGHPGLDVNAHASENETALHHAARKGRDGFVRILIEDPRTDVNALDEFGSTPLMQAVMWSRVSVVETLLRDDRVDVNVVREDDDDVDEPMLMTALRYATKQKRPGDEQDRMNKIIHLLVGNPRTDVNVADFQGRPLDFFAADRNDEALLKKIYAHPTMKSETTDSVEEKILDMLGMLKNASTRGKCNYCGLKDDLKKCGACECARYCCVDHQEKDWKRHKPLCLVLSRKQYQ